MAQIRFYIVICQYLILQSRHRTNYKTKQKTTPNQLQMLPQHFLAAFAETLKSSIKSNFKKRNFLSK